MADHEAASPAARAFRAGLVSCVIYTALSHAIFQDTWAADLLIGIPAGLAGGIVTGVGASRQKKAALAAAAGSMSLGHQREAYHASTSSTVPANPRVQAAAAALVRARLDRLASTQARTLRGQAVLAVLGCVLAVVIAPAFLVITAMSMLGMWTIKRLPATLTERLARLDETA